MKSPAYRIGIPAAIVVAIGILLLAPISVPWSISSTGIIVPAREWVLLRGAGGEMQSLLRDNETGAVQEYSLLESERGDPLTFLLAPALRGATSVNKGDTVGWASSPELAQQLTTLEGELAIAEAGLSVARTGEKPATVEQARRQLDYARKAHDEQAALHARNAELHARHALSDQEFELSRDRLELLRISIDIARTQLDVVSTGLKNEEQRAYATIIDARRADVAAARSRMLRLARVSPLSGLLRANWSADTLLVVQDTVSSVLLIPVPLERLSLVQPKQRVDFRVVSTRAAGTAHVSRVNGTAQRVGTAMVSVVMARINAVETLPPGGAQAECGIVCGELPLREYLWRMIREWMR